MTAELNTAAGNNVQYHADLENRTTVMAADALWLNAGYSTLSVAAIANIQDFIATGKRVVMLGEYAVQLPDWDKQILGIVGGSLKLAPNNIDYAYCNSLTLSIDNQLTLTYCVSSVYVPTGGLVVGGTALFNQNWATLWGANQNVLTILDTNFNADYYYSREDNAKFSENIAEWISAPAVVPEPSTCIAGGLLLLPFGATIIRRFRK